MVWYLLIKLPLTRTYVSEKSKNDARLRPSFPLSPNQAKMSWSLIRALMYCSLVCVNYVAKDEGGWGIMCSCSQAAEEGVFAPT